MCDRQAQVLFCADGHTFKSIETTSTISFWVTTGRMDDNWVLPRTRAAFSGGAVGEQGVINVQGQVEHGSKV